MNDDRIMYTEDGKIIVSRRNSCVMTAFERNMQRLTAFERNMQRYLKTFSSDNFLNYARDLGNILNADYVIFYDIRNNKKMQIRLDDVFSITDTQFISVAGYIITPENWTAVCLKYGC